MMTARQTMTISADLIEVRPTEFLELVAGSVPMLVLAGPVYLGLRDELGCDRRALKWLIRLASRVGKPIAINLPLGDGNSKTIMLGPSSWSAERLAGYTAGFREELEQAFGPATVFHDD
jgi:hypothetical protein